MDSDYSIDDAGQCFDFGAIAQERPSVVSDRGFEGPWHAVLGVDPGASLTEVRAAYWAAIRAYHPDLVALLGPKIQEVAAAETQRINQAYEQAKRALSDRS